MGKFLYSLGIRKTFLLLKTQKQILIILLHKKFLKTFAGQKKKILRTKVDDKVGKTICNLFINKGLMSIICRDFLGTEAHRTLKDLTCNKDKN